MKRFFAVICVVLLFCGIFSVVQAQSDTPSVDLSYRWHKTELKALIVTNESEPWWQPYFVTLVQRAITQWNQAFGYYATNFTDYAYMDAVNVVLDFSDLTLPDYDIYINFTKSIPIGSSSDALGLTTTIPYQNGTIERVYLQLSSESKNVDLTRSNERDVCGHELGHALGLGHSNSSSDIMYPYYDMYSSENAISTLDLFGLATCFNWINMPSNSTAKNPLPQFVVLPSNLPYLYAPITDPAPKGVGDNPLVRTLEILFSSPYTITMVATFLGFLILAGLLYMRMGKRRRKTKPITQLAPA